MDFSWSAFCSTFWFFPLLFLVFAAVMMIACTAMHFRRGGLMGCPCVRSDAGKAQHG